MTKTWETTDLGSAAFVVVSGIDIHGVKKATTRGGQFVFMFEDPENKCPELQVDFMNSDCRKFDAAVRSLKKLCYDSRSSGDQDRRRR